ncbi:hypothetical protein FA95DRAFT_1554806 [Auriscalpium vulgare]|uniref:Uncharacterized protein n=1 Tax=Auriscalpium vulgare TaxID=40419 RepID=A0ACB8S517_9AGAM|nr:hypothetical protein FA95DRAFT_1554806 [Auriscalpium vulgare]
MASVLSPGRASPTPLPSLPPSPTEEEDLGRPAAWVDEDDNHSPDLTPTSNAKGKARATGSALESSYAEGGTDEALRRIDEGGDTETYPPMSGDEAETRRIEENLRRWEIAERQRRKAARDAAAGSPLSKGSSVSVVAGVARRASLLWPSKRASREGAGAHRALRTSEDAVALEDIEGSPSPSPSPTPNPVSQRNRQYTQADNPFADPGGSSSSLFVNAVPQAGDSSPQSSSAIAASDSGVSFTAKADQRPPQPLDLPQPRSPPPRTETPHSKRPPEPRSPPSTSPAPRMPEEEEPPVKWWTEWLCGCSEHGEFQAARTNPLE